MLKVQTTFSFSKKIKLKIKLQCKKSPIIPNCWVFITKWNSLTVESEYNSTDTKLHIIKMNSNSNINILTTILFSIVLRNPRGFEDSIQV